MVGRIKILASMNGAGTGYRRMAAFVYHRGAAGVDLRISIIPSQFGESVVIRVLARTADMRQPGFDWLQSTDLARLRCLLRRSMGIVLVTGPTGSGKTTTLAALQEVVRQNVNIVTVEDPSSMNWKAWSRSRSIRPSSSRFPAPYGTSCAMTPMSS